MKIKLRRNKMKTENWIHGWLKSIWKTDKKLFSMKGNLNLARDKNYEKMRNKIYASLQLNEQNVIDLEKQRKEKNK
jgi:hypothetical protein